MPEDNRKRTPPLTSLQNIVIEVDGGQPDDDAAVDALLAPLAVRRHDTVIAVKKFAVVEGLPRIASVTSL